jgi:hypothetical protein
MIRYLGPSMQGEARRMVALMADVCIISNSAAALGRAGPSPHRAGRRHLRYLHLAEGIHVLGELILLSAFWDPEH